MLSPRSQYLSRVLDDIEQQEARLLVWGVVDGSFEENELLALINTRIDAELAEGRDEFLDAQEVLSALQAGGLILQVDNGVARRAYRSRMAETARLMLRLRQLFPKHDRKPSGWLDAPTLVADFRFQRRRRHYPKRDVRTDSAIAQLRDLGLAAPVIQALAALLRTDDPSFRLAAFQVRAAERILRALKTDKVLATIVCAGTGSGKTLAFYLPALSWIAGLTASDTRPWVKALALYPRTELLKDQFRELTRRALILRVSGTNVRVGALFADTPLSAKDCSWPISGSDRVCPMLACPACGGELLWRHDDHSHGRERLECRNCHEVLDESVLSLTRHTLTKRPPDILFTTTEMLNQRLSDTRYRHLFGIGPRSQRAPELVLLDEVHTYEGRQGAQVAYLLRRWQHLLNRPLRFVGLSATLREAETFFASLTATLPSAVQEISPRSDEMESEGAEYLMALRGDPVSRAALLSTTIQTSALMERCLDPRGTRLSEGLFGQRTFIFTDNLDVTNRLYFDLLSAEGRGSSGQPDFARAPNGGLAHLRASRNSLARYRGGQDWRACEQLGHQLTTRLAVDRVSSQDRGVDPEADLVVATAALEVGFDDPLAGAVIQHKAPRGAAGFLQRRGRAGRVRGMRPWTVVVLSDYGRDRTAYQAYDQLFDPQIDVRVLPLANRTIRRMQSAYALVDFLGQRLERSPPGSAWSDLAEPPRDAARRADLIRELLSLLESGQSTERFAEHLESALQLPREEITALLWEFPRPIITGAVPTALRRLLSDWSANGQARTDFRIRNNPLPDFIPATLFAELNLAEVVLEFPPGAQGDRRPEEVMPILTALREFAPGRVSRRFGTRFRTERYWIAPSMTLPPQGVERIALSAIGQHTFLGTFERWMGDQSMPIPVYRPLRLTPSGPPANIADSSNARLLWHTQLIPLGAPIDLPLPHGSAWDTIFTRLRVYTHSKQAPLEVRRFATGSRAEVGVGPGNRVGIECTFELDGVPAGLGLSFEADAIAIELRVPANLSVTSLTDTAKGRALRTVRYLDQAWRGEVLAGIPNPFMREWLAHILLSALTYEAIRAQTDLRAASESLRAGQASIRLQDVLSALFQSQIIESDGQRIILDGDDRLRQDLQALLGQPTIVDELHASARLLWDSSDPAWEPWLAQVYESTIAAGVLRAIGDLCPTLDTEDLIVDLGRGPSVAGLDSGPASGTREIWISEKSPGGNGHVEEFLRLYAQDPRRFFSGIRAALEVSEFEIIDAQLSTLTRLLLDDTSISPVRESVRQFRASDTHAEMTRLSKELRVGLVREGFSVFHAFLTALGTRVLRPGTGPETDTFVDQAMRRWRAEEARLGVEIDLRIMTYCLSQSDDIDEVAREAGLPAAQDLPSWRMSTIYGLLWARGTQVRHYGLELYNPFAELPQVERLLVIDRLQEERVLIDLEDPQWFATAAGALSEGHLVTLRCTDARGELLAEALSFLVTNPIDSGYLRSYARLHRVRRSDDSVEADVELVEAVQ